MTSQSRILYLNRRDVESICHELDVVAIVKEALSLHAAREVILPDEAYLSWTNAAGETARSLNMPSFLAGSFNSAGTKIINGNPDNSKRGLPRASGLTILFDIETSCVTSILDAAYISGMRTAAVTAISAELLGRLPIERLAVIGAGALARAHLDLLPARLAELKSVRLFDLDSVRARSLEDEIRPYLEARGVSVDRSSTAEQAIRGADLVVAVTTTTVSYIEYSWLAPGSLVVNISLDDLTPEVILKAARLVVDDWALICADRKRLLGRMYREGLIVGPDIADTGGAVRRVDAELGQIINGFRPGRANRDEIVVVNPFGLSIEDIAVASRVHKCARVRNIGTWLPVN
jgi:ornithine cyclodeaminase